MKQTNTDQTMIRKQCLHITTNHYRNERWTTKDGELTKKSYQK